MDDRAKRNVAPTATVVGKREEADDVSPSPGGEGRGGAALLSLCIPLLRWTLSSNPKGQVHLLRICKALAPALRIVLQCA
jgi:hypothetical protein